MVPLTIIGLFVLGIFNLKFRQLAFALTSLLLFNERFRRSTFAISRLFILGLRNKNARKSAFRNSKKMFKIIIGKIA